jgi:hypothetical protein
VDENQNHEMYNVAITTLAGNRSSCFAEYGADMEQVWMQ